MPVGLDEAVGLVALSLTCFHGCVQGLITLSKARHYHSDVSGVRLQIEIAQSSLFAWAEEAGLTREPPALLVSRGTAQLVPNILEHLQRLLLDLRTLRERYDLDLQTTSEVVEELNDQDTTLSKLGPRQREFVQRTEATVFRKRLQPWKRLRWVTLDDKKVAKLLGQVREYIACLNQYLEPARQAKCNRKIELAFREAILHTNDPLSLSVIENEFEQAPANLAISAAARLKQVRNELELGEEPRCLGLESRALLQWPSVHGRKNLHSPRCHPEQMKLKIRRLTLPRAARAQPSRALAYYDGRVILLEWKSCMNSDLSSLEGRVSQIAAFLHELEPSFHSLPCQGFVKDVHNKRFGYIFNLPEHLHPLEGFSSTSKKPLPELMSLNQVFECPPAAMPTLNKRLSIAIILIDTLLNLHSSDFLHKELHSENVILIRKALPSNSPLGFSGRPDTSFDLSDFSVHIAGYVYARADGPDEQTEAPWFGRNNINLYRHPASLGSEREKFRKSFDIFSVACTLLEIGLWKSLSTILHEHAHQGPTTLDIIRLRHDLLISKITAGPPRRQPFRAHVSSSSSFGTPPSSSCTDSSESSAPGGILRSLAIAAGERYASLVEELISAATAKRKATGVSKTRSLTSSGDFGDEHEDALELEYYARDTVRGILEAI